MFSVCFVVSVCPFVCLFATVCFCSSVYLFMHINLCQSVCSDVYRCICFCLSIFLSFTIVCVFVFFYLSVWFSLLFFCLFVSVCVCVSFVSSARWWCFERVSVSCGFCLFNLTWQREAQLEFSTKRIFAKLCFQNLFSTRFVSERNFSQRIHRCLCTYVGNCSSYDSSKYV
jgi:hypothetical protein